MQRLEQTVPTITGLQNIQVYTHNFYVTFTDATLTTATVVCYKSIQINATGSFFRCKGSSESSADRGKRVESCLSSSLNGLETLLWANTSLTQIQIAAGTDSHTNLRQKSFLSA